MQEPFQTRKDIRERQSFDVIAAIRDRGELVPSDQIDSITVTIYKLSSNGAITILNDRDAQDVFNANGGEYYDDLQIGEDSDGNTVGYNFLFHSLPDDHEFLGEDSARHQIEIHIARFTFTWGGGTGEYSHEIEYRVHNFRGYPAVVS